MKRDDLIDIMHRYRRGEIKSADDAADEIIAAVAQICGACGQPWNGEGCGQKDNGHPFQTCYPITPAPLPEHARGGPTAANPGRRCCKDDGSCCNFCCGN